MPYRIVKRGAKFVVEKQDGSRTFGVHDTEADAKKQLAALYAAEPGARSAEQAESRALHLLGATGAARTETIDGKEYLVVPVVALMEGVIHAVNAATPEFVSVDTLRKAAPTWNGRPVTLGHPKKNGAQCSADSPDVVASHGIGVIRNSRVDEASKKLLQEAWIEKAKAKRLHPDMYARLEANESEEVSVGAYVVTDKKAGEHGGKPFKASWLETVGDHLAFLPGGRGACSLEMGCGAHRAAMRVCEDHLELLGALPDKAQVEVEGHMKVGDKVKIDKKGHESDGKSGTVTAIIGDMHKVGSLGAFKRSELRFAAAAAGATDPEEVAELVAYQTMRSVWDACDAQWDQAGALIDDLISDETDDPTESDEEEQAEEQIETARIESIRTILQAMAGSIQGLIGLTYGAALGDAPRYMASATRDCVACNGTGVAGRNPCEACDGSGQVPALKAAAGARHNAADTKAIQAVHDHAQALGAVCDRANYRTMGNIAGGNIAEGDPKLARRKMDGGDRKMDDPTRRYIAAVAGRKAAG